MMTRHSFPRAVIGKGIHRLALISSRNPIEMFAAVLLLASFSYFYLYNLARTSDIFSGTNRLHPATVHALPGANHFEPGGLDANAVQIHLRQIITPTDHVLFEDDFNALCYKQADHSCFVDQCSDGRVLSLALDASNPVRRALSHQWSQKIASDDQQQQNLFVWLFIIARNVVLRLKELIDVNIIFIVCLCFRTCRLMIPFFLDG